MNTKSLAVAGALWLGAILIISQLIPMASVADPVAAPGAGAGHASGDLVARGQYLTKVMVCNDCHTPWVMTPRGPEPDMTRMLSGHPESMVVSAPPALGDGGWTWAALGTNTAFAGPWGVSFTANLTPDPETGLGKWTVDTFIAAIRSGRHEGQGRPILPPMPWPMYRNASDEDLRAIFAYLQTIPPVHNRVPLPLDPPEAQ